MRAQAEAPETAEEIIAQLRAGGTMSDRWIEYLERSLQPGGEKCILPGETRAQAVARLSNHYGYDERTAEFTISPSQGLSDVVPDEPMTRAEKRAIGLGVIAGEDDDQTDGPGRDRS